MQVFKDRELRDKLLKAIEKAKGNMQGGAEN